MRNKFRIYDQKRFKRLNNDLYILPELLPKKEIDKFINIWIDVYNYDIPTRAILKSNVDVKEMFFKTDIGELLGRDRRDNKKGRH